MSLVIGQGGQPICDSLVDTKCTLDLSSAFTVEIVPDTIPPGGYGFWQTLLQYGALDYKPASDVRDEISRDLSSGLPRGSIGPGTVLHGALSSFFPPLPLSTQTTTLVTLDFNCTESETLSLLPYSSDFQAGSTYGGEDGNVIVPAVGSLIINCEPPPASTPTPTSTPRPAVRKSPTLSNLWLTAQGDKLAPDTCLAGSDGVTLTQAMSRKVDGLDRHGDPRDLGGFSFQVNFDETKVCMQLAPGPLAQAWLAAGGACIIYDSTGTPNEGQAPVQGSATIACNSMGKGPKSPPVEDNLLLAEVIVRPMPDEYSVMRPNNGNGNVVQIINKACKLTDRQGNPIAPPEGRPTCTDADITIRYLEGDVVPDCVVDSVDTQAEAFRWGSQKGALLYSDFFNTEPSKPKQDDDIDINDLQFVYGRFGSTCDGPFQQPEQAPVNPKAS